MGAWTRAEWTLLANIEELVFHIKAKQTNSCSWVDFPPVLPPSMAQGSLGSPQISAPQDNGKQLT